MLLGEAAREFAVEEAREAAREVGGEGKGEVEAEGLGSPLGDPDFTDPSVADTPNARQRVPSPRLPSPLPTLRVPARSP